MRPLEGIDWHALDSGAFEGFLSLGHLLFELLNLVLERRVLRLECLDVDSRGRTERHLDEPAKRHKERRRQEGAK